MKVNNMNPSTIIFLMACMLASVQLTFGQSKGTECSKNTDCDNVLECIGGRCIDRCDDVGTCGVNAECTTNDHSPTCRCAPNHTGNPLSKCTPVEPEVECPPNACGINAFCKVHSGLAICSCLDSYVGDPFSGCRREVHIVDESVIPVDKDIVNPKYPCDPDPCSENEICRELNGKASCQCRFAPYLRLPESGCNPECVSKFNCAAEQTCINAKCVDSCPGSCGPNEECYVFNHKAKCRPKNSRPECTSDKDCSSAEACDGFKCVDPCVDYCDRNTDCRTVNQQPKCTCKAGYHRVYDQCYREGTIVE